jgi:cytochrome c peroxidase
VALGRNLFFDKVLSGNRNIACASCHQPAVATGDGLSLALGEGAVGMAPNRVATASVQVIARNAPPLFALGHQGVLFRDGRVQRDPATGALTTPEPVLNGPTPTRPDLTAPLTTALAAQALFPVATHAEMRGETGTNELANAPDNVTVWALIMARLVGTQNGTQGGIAEYRTEFQAAFPAVTSFDLLTFSHAAQAIAAFEIATFTLLDTPFDQYLAGNLQALSAQQKSGALVFSGRGRCVQCHKGPLLSDESFHALAIPQLGPGAGGEPDDRGRALISGDTRDNYRFRTPPLRNVGTTGPYMHDGAFVTLDRILQHYRNPAQSLQSYTGSELTPALQATVDHDPTRDQARLAAVDPIIGPGIPLSPQDTQDLIAFLGALTDPAATSAASVPATVPSGLPVAD